MLASLVCSIGRWSSRVQFRDAEQAPLFPLHHSVLVPLPLPLFQVPSGGYLLLFGLILQSSKSSRMAFPKNAQRLTLILWETFGVSGPPPVELAKPLRAFATRSANLFVAILSPANVVFGR